MAAEPARSPPRSRTRPARRPCATPSTAAYDQQVAADEARSRSLLEQLAEWDNYQSILTLTRDLLNGQKNLSERTRQYIQEH